MEAQENNIINTQLKQSDFIINNILKEITDSYQYLQKIMHSLNIDTYHDFFFKDMNELQIPSTYKYLYKLSPYYLIASKSFQKLYALLPDDFRNDIIEMHEYEIIYYMVTHIQECKTLLKLYWKQEFCL